MKVIDVHDEGEMVAIEFVKDGDIDFCHMERKFWNGLKETNGSDQKALEAYFAMVKASAKYD